MKQGHITLGLQCLQSAHGGLCIKEPNSIVSVPMMSLSIRNAMKEGRSAYSAEYFVLSMGVESLISSAASSQATADRTSVAPIGSC